MQERVTIDDGGVITLPATLREAFGLKANDELIAESSGEGILLRPVATERIEDYTEERIAEFAEEDAAIGERLRRGG